MSQDKGPLAVVTTIGGGAVVVAVAWTLLTGAFLHFIPIGLAIAMGTLAAKAVYSETTPKGKQRGKRK